MRPVPRAAHRAIIGRPLRGCKANGRDFRAGHADPRLLERAHKAVANLVAEGRDSRLGTALRQVIDHYRGASLSAVVMFTDGVTTKDETIQQVGEYAALKGVPLFFVGIGDVHEDRDVRLHDLQVEDNVYVNDRLVFELRLTGQGYENLAVPVTLREKGKDRPLDVQQSVRVDPSGQAVRVLFQPLGLVRFLLEGRL